MNSSPLVVGGSSDRRLLDVGVDIGGTFTDFVLVNRVTGEVRRGKRLTTPEDPSRAVLEGLRELLDEQTQAALQLGSVLHATTLATNALIERRGVPTGLLTTAGHRDALEIGKEIRYDMYDLFLERPEPLVPRPWRREVVERTAWDGRVLRPLEVSEAVRAAADLVAEGVESLALCFLHSYANPSHERAAAEGIRAAFPGLAVSVSSEVCPVLREFERVSTTVANAYVQPIVESYLTRLESGVAELGRKGRLFVMLSNGGLAIPETARAYPIRLVESGPAAGAVAAASVGRRLGLDRVLSLDMGGTTAKICLIDRGEPDTMAEFEVGRVHRFKRGSGLPVALQAVDLLEIGAGGGSIARVDALGFVAVGPESAAARPGPACYGLGGREPTVTDADLLLGCISADSFAGGKMRLDREAAALSIQRELGGKLGLDTLHAAAALRAVVDENMATALRIHCAEKGRDPRAYTLVAFGGAGPVHAYRLAQALQIPRLLVPSGAGLLSALGLVESPVAFDFARSRPTTLRTSGLSTQPPTGTGPSAETSISSSLDPELLAVDKLYDEMEEAAKALLDAASVAPESRQLRRSADMRYAGQGFEIAVRLPERPFTDFAPLLAGFDSQYRKLFGHAPGDVPVEALTWRLRASASPLDRPQAAAYSSASGSAPTGHRPVCFDEEGFRETSVYRRDLLCPGDRLEGPAVVEEDESTAVIGPGATAEVDDLGNLVVLLPQAK